MREIALHILDIAENSVAAGANRIRVSYELDVESGKQDIRVIDNGKGMKPEEAEGALDPFYTTRTTRKVGLGLSLFRQHAELTGGGLEVESQMGRGTSVHVTMFGKHPDSQPLGDLEGCWLLLAGSYSDIEWSLDCKTGEGEFNISSTEIERTLGEKFRGGNELSGQLRRMIRNNLEELGISPRSVPIEKSIK